MPRRSVGGAEGTSSDSESLHLAERRFDCPVIERDAGECHHETGPIGARLAVDEDSLLWIVVEQREEGRHLIPARFVDRAPRQIHELHPQADHHSSSPAHTATRPRTAVKPQIAVAAMSLRIQFPYRLFFATGRILAFTERDAGVSPR